MAEKAKIVAIGPEQEITALRAVGVEIVPLEDGSALGEALAKHAKDEAVGLILVSETVADGRQQLISDIRHENDAVILVVPSYRGSKETTLEYMKHALELSIGVDLISKV